MNRTLLNKSYSYIKQKDGRSSKSIIAPPTFEGLSIVFNSEWILAISRSLNNNNTRFLAAVLIVYYVNLTKTVA